MSQPSVSARLTPLLRDLPVEVVGPPPRAEVGRAATITSIVEDSRQVAPGSLFVARAGTVADGARYIDDAIARGAVAVLSAAGAERTGTPARASERAGENDGVVHLVARDVPRVAAALAERFYASPSRSLDLVGITGTNGKTTVAYLVHQLLNGVGGMRCGMMGTVAIDDGSVRETDALPAATLTTPPAYESSRLLRSMVDHGCRACVMEVSSHALDQERTAGLTFAGAIFTNISGDHLDYHGTMPAYVAAKRRLFSAVPAAGWAVINADDPAAPAMIDATAGRVITTSLSDPAHVSARIDAMTTTGATVRLTGPWGAFEVTIPLVGAHNVTNAMQAAAAAHALGLDAATLREGLSRVHAPPGRLQRVTDDDAEITVLVDYAHTDDALRNVLDALRPLVPPSGRLVTVFGCGGDRDRSKRPRMAAAAAAGSDALYVTSDNPRTEDPAAIVDEVVAGLPDPTASMPVRRIVDRREAIFEAITTARPHDVVVVAGKGHEDYQIIGTERRDFDDRVVAAEALNTRRETGMRRPVGGGTNGGGRR